MQRSILSILRQRTGASPETFQFTLNLLVATASFLFTLIFYYANKQKSIRIYGGGNSNSGSHCRKTA